MTYNVFGETLNLALSIRLSVHGLVFPLDLLPSDFSLERGIQTIHPVPKCAICSLIYVGDELLHACSTSCRSCS